MKPLLRQLFARPLFALELLLLSLFISILALGSSIYTIQVLNRYLSHGLNATLITLTVGVIIVIAMEFLFRQVRLKLAQGVTVPPSAKLAQGTFALMTQAMASSILAMNPIRRREVLQAPTIVERNYAAPTLVAMLDAPFALLFIGVLFLLQPQLGWITASFIALAVLLTIIGNALLTRPTQHTMFTASQAGALAQAAMWRPESLRAFNARNHYNQRWQQYHGEATQAGRRVAALKEMLLTATQSLAALMSVSVIAAGAMLVMEGKLDVGMMIGANILAARAMAPMARLSQLVGPMVETKRATESLNSFGQIPQEPQKQETLSSFSGQIALEELGFSHAGAPTPLFESLSLNLPPGGTLVVCGANGCGKTTLAKLLMGLHSPSRGQIKLDGAPLEALSLTWWRSQVAYVPQNPEFLDGTLLENLTLLNPELQRDQLEQLIQQSGLGPYINSQPDGLESMVHNGGENLSFGIRKRLAIARALTSACRLAILDDPMEGMDNQGRTTMSSVITTLTRSGRSVILFTEDDQLIHGADLVLNLDSKPVPTLTQCTQRGEAPQ
uniref:Putative ABC transporter, transmembrane region:ABC transporter. Putative Xenobiotic-transporting ATPase n=1 Tax=Magnetococcus massalia (strain MO-1) TaxID=451514 RepID=A0A1S7LFI3_MAGMO|nr:putative ABC transporter, transmembrane region:ABC transporter. Putative Xenobiotic-transporting ATPase [Candidatus Magnetococcus massalia]